MSGRRVPVTLLTGFLGAGKTTLLNAVLHDPAAGRVAVIVNEFGDAGLDHDLIEQSDEEIVLMQSGCLCCTVRGDLSRTVQDLLQRRAQDEIAFDRIIIETTGLADPGPIHQTLQVDPFLAGTVRMDGIVTVADAVNGAKTLDAQFEAVSQAAMADLIVISKTDIAWPIAIETLQHRLRALNSGARIISSVRGEGLIGALWHLTALRDDSMPTDILAWTAPAPRADALARATSFGNATAPAPHSSPHDGRIVTASIELHAPITDRLFDTWLETLIALRGPNILRVKGIVFLDRLDTPFVFHGVQHVFDRPRPVKDWPSQDTRTRIVVIARDMTQEELERSFDMLRAHEAIEQTAA